MRLPHAVQDEHPWLVRELAPDFALDEVWEFPICANARKGETFRTFCALEDAARTEPLSGPAELLVRFRMLLGKLGVDRATNRLPIPGCHETSVRARMKPEPLEPTVEPDARFPFRVVYDLDTERLLEFSNGTVHALFHLSWAPIGEALHAPRMAVYVKPRGWYGQLYLALIYPFRIFVVYPAVMRAAKRRWDGRKGAGRG